MQYVPGEAAERVEAMKQRSRIQTMLWSMLAMLVLICCLLPMPAQAVPGLEGCSGSLLGQHEWSSFGTEATCTTDGTIYWVCNKCGERVAETIPATGHVWDEGVVTEWPSCEEDGVIVYTCYACGETWAEPLYAYGHNWDEGVVTV